MSQLRTNKDPTTKLTIPWRAQLTGNIITNNTMFSANHGSHNVGVHIASHPYWHHDNCVVKDPCLWPIYGRWNWWRHSKPCLLRQHHDYRFSSGERGRDCVGTVGICNTIQMGFGHTDTLLIVACQSRYSTQTVSICHALALMTVSLPVWTRTRSKITCGDYLRHRLDFSSCTNDSYRWSCPLVTACPGLMLTCQVLRRLACQVTGIGISIIANGSATCTGYMFPQRKVSQPLAMPPDSCSWLTVRGRFWHQCWTHWLCNIRVCWFLAQCMGNVLWCRTAHQRSLTRVRWYLRCRANCRNCSSTSQQLKIVLESRLTMLPSLAKLLSDCLLSVRRLLCCDNCLVVCVQCCMCCVCLCVDSCVSHVFFFCRKASFRQKRQLGGPWPDPQQTHDEYTLNCCVAQGHMLWLILFPASGPSRSQWFVHAGKVYMKIMLRYFDLEGWYIHCLGFV